MPPITTVVSHCEYLSQLLYLDQGWECCRLRCAGRLFHLAFLTLNGLRYRSPFRFVGEALHLLYLDESGHAHDPIPAVAIHAPAVH